MKQSTVIYLLLYIVCMGAVYFGLRSAQASAIETYGTNDAQVEWESWRQEVRDLDVKKGPTSRRVPKSDAPPALVLMRDYFVACLVFSLVMTSALYWTTVVVFRGSLRPTVVREE
jgi:hypothetical protein